MQQEKIILGIDPGTNYLGYGVIQVKGKSMSLLDIGVLKINSKEDLGIKLKAIYFEIIRLINLHHPDHLAIESQFFGENIQSMLKLGKAQGVSIAAALSRDIPFSEYPPKKIKQSITGNGNASKEQVAGMLKNLLQLKEIPEKLDATDGLAAAVCHFFQESSPLSSNKYSGWKAYVNDHPKKIK